MAERKQDDPKREDAPPADPPAPPTAPPVAPTETPQQRTQRLMAADAIEAEEKKLDETVPGGRYRTADGRVVDANGEPIKE